MSVKNPEQFWKNIQNKPNYIDYILPNRTEKEFWQEGKDQAKYIENFIEDFSNILEYGCGIGRIAINFKQFSIHGVEITPKFREKCKEIGLKVFSENEIQLNTYSFIYSIMVLQHNSEENRMKIIKNIHSMLKDGGKVFIQFPKFESTIYTETEFVHKFKKSEIEQYGKLFKKYEIVTGNLINYKSSFSRKEDNEYFLIAWK